MTINVEVNMERAAKGFGTLVKKCEIVRRCEGLFTFKLEEDAKRFFRTLKNGTYAFRRVTSAEILDDGKTVEVRWIIKDKDIPEFK
jgi:hypothetical protein